MRDILTSFLLIAGVLWVLIAAIGIIRLPDVLCRSHAVAKAFTLGLFLMLLGYWAYLGEGVSGLKVALAIFFQLITIPVASHLIGLLAFRKNLRRWKRRPMDDHRITKEPQSSKNV
ncbi:MAG: monovalent cation/H(+) antiporter subunit G [Verrucomicrobia bacterium]|nr:monovalent cation/H(+) antiporter subunit G [Verrucomicrobiota bacterium]